MPVLIYKWYVLLNKILLGKSLIETNQLAEAKSCLEIALDLAIQQNHEDPKTEVLQLLEDLPT